MTRMYIAGPMSGIADYNYPFFWQAEDNLSAMKPEWEFVNPARHDGDTLALAVLKARKGQRTWQDYIREAITALVTCDSIILLPGWTASKGARLEARIAIALGMETWYYEEASEHYNWSFYPIHSRFIIDNIERAESNRPTYVLEPKVDDETVCAEADRIVVEDRMVSYGHPLDNFTQTGRMWGAILGIDDIPAPTVGLMMVAGKISRETHAPKRDNLVDMCGYAKTVDMSYIEAKRRSA